MVQAVAAAGSVAMSITLTAADVAAPDLRAYAATGKNRRFFWGDPAASAARCSGLAGWAGCGRVSTGIGPKGFYTRSPKSGTMCRIGDLVLAGWVAKLASAVQPTRGSDPRLISKLGDCV